MLYRPSARCTYNNKKTIKVIGQSNECKKQLLEFFLLSYTYEAYIVYYVQESTFLLTIRYHYETLNSILQSHY